MSSAVPLRTAEHSMNREHARSLSQVRFGAPDLVFGVFLLLVFLRSGGGMVDDPGLGWHLRIPDLMWEKGAFLHTEEWAWKTAGKPWVAYGWLGDIPLRLAYAWGGLNAVAAFTSVMFAWVIRLLFCRMQTLGISWPTATFWCFAGLMGILTSLVARPNMYSFLGIVLTVWLAEGFHRGQISRQRTLWLLPIFAAWANMHGGFLAGALILGLVYLTEAALAIFASQPASRESARSRLKWWTLLGPGIFVATLLTPYGLGLYTWSLELITDPYLQTQSTTEWLPPNFKDVGWVWAELLILALPALAMASRTRINAVAIVIVIGLLHFGLTSLRYTPLWVVVAVPMLAELSQGMEIWKRWGNSLRGQVSPDFFARIGSTGQPGSWGVSFGIGLLLILISPWLPAIAHHLPQHFPEKALQKVIDDHSGERVFHTANWGGYLVFHGWDAESRFRIWIDDRIDVHGRELLDEYRDLMNAQPGWQKSILENGIQAFCIERNCALAEALAQDPAWKLEYEDEYAVIFGRSVDAAGHSERPQTD